MTILQNKVALIYGAAGAVGSAVAKAFAAEGAIVCLAGRTSENLHRLASEIHAAGGEASVFVTDALNKKEVEHTLDGIIAERGKIDISFNLISLDDLHGYPLVNMEAGDFVKPIVNAMNSHFITGTAAARHMHSGGVILALTANAARKPYPELGGFGIACAAIEAFCRQLALEEGPRGIRVVCLRSAGSPDAPGVDEVFTVHAANSGVSREEFDRNFAEATMLKRLPLLKDVADVAVLAASDKASTLTAAILNLTCGEIAD